MNNKKYLSACCRKELEDYDIKHDLGYCPKCGFLASALNPNLPIKSTLSEIDHEMLATPTECSLLTGHLSLKHLLN